jgi:hypothetical protein
MITTTLPIDCEEDYEAASARLRDEAADLLRQLDRLDPAAPSTNRQMLVNRLDVVLLEQERVEWQEQQRIGGW